MAAFMPSKGTGKAIAEASETFWGRGGARERVRNAQFFKLGVPRVADFAPPRAASGLSGFTQTTGERAALTIL